MSLVKRYDWNNRFRFPSIRECPEPSDDWESKETPWHTYPRSASSHLVKIIVSKDDHSESLPSALKSLKHEFKKTITLLRFDQLAKEWKDETGIHSNVTTRAMHPTYQQIIGLGDNAVPLILEDLKDNGPDDWFWALTAITGENPITEEIAGDMHAMTEAWLQWGRQTGYLRNFAPAY